MSLKYRDIIHHIPSGKKWVSKEYTMKPNDSLLNLATQLHISACCTSYVLEGDNSAFSLSSCILDDCIFEVQISE